MPDNASQTGQGGVSTAIWQAKPDDALAGLQKRRHPLTVSV